MSVPILKGLPRNTESVTPQKNVTAGMTSANPTPGGPAPYNSSVRNALAQEIVSAQTLATQTAGKLGIQTPAPGSIAERGYKVGGKTILQDELNQVKELQTKAVKDYLNQFNFTTGIQTSLAENYMNNRLNTIRKSLLKAANEFNVKLEKYKLSEEERRMAAKNWGAFAGAVVGGVIGSGSGVPGTLLGAGLGAKAGGTLTGLAGDIF